MFPHETSVRRKRHALRTNNLHTVTQTLQSTWTLEACTVLHKAAAQNFGKSLFFRAA